MPTVNLPTLHRDQVAAFRVPGRFKVIRCGRRWGKTVFGETLAGDGSTKGRRIGWFAPQHKFITEPYRDAEEMLEPVLRSSNQTKGLIRTTTGGSIRFWSLEDPRAGRGDKYHLVIIDEAAFTEPGSIDTWNKSIKPTLLDYGGRAVVLSNTNGDDPENLLWQLCHQPEHGFVQYHAPTHSNPLLPAAEVEKLKRENHPLVYRQEYLAEFVDWSGEAFFGADKWLVNGQPIEAPAKCDYVFAIIDSATKTGKQHDGTGVVYFLRNKHTWPKLAILDWDLVQIEGALLETWLPNVFANLEHLAVKHGAREGVRGTWIEDKSSGSVLIQKATSKNWPAEAIDTRLTALGKDERAIGISGNHYRGEIQITCDAHDKVITYKGATRNHLITQVAGFRVGDKDAARREDDLLDCYTYGVELALGAQEWAK